MPDKKKQHYVPQMYMDLFANSKKEFGILNVATKEVRYPVPYKSQCYKDYFYGKDHIWEDRLSQMENEWRDTMNLVRGQQSLSSVHIQRLKRFALYQRQRTWGESQYSKKVREELLVEQGKVFCASKGLIFTDELRERCLERVREEATPAEHLLDAEEYCNTIDDLSAVIINYTTERSLVSSDVPVIAINPFELHSIGYGCMGLILLFPVTPHQLAVIYDANMYPRFKGKLYVDVDNENKVRNLNVLQLISAEKILFAYDKTDFNCFSAMDWQIRSRNRETEAIHSLGSSTNKMIVASPRKVILDREFTFGKVHSTFAGIPYSCREAVPRLWDESWEKKLKEKGDIIAGISIHQPQILYSMGISKKEFRRGCQMMLRAAQAYWKNSHQ